MLGWKALDTAPACLPSGARWRYCICPAHSNSCSVAAGLPDRLTAKPSSASYLRRYGLSARHCSGVTARAGEAAFSARPHSAHAVPRKAGQARERPRARRGFTRGLQPPGHWQQVSLLSSRHEVGRAPPGLPDGPPDLRPAAVLATSAGGGCGGSESTLPGERPKRSARARELRAAGENQMCLKAWMVHTLAYPAASFERNVMYRYS